MKGFKPWLVIGLVFFAGIAVGVIGMRAFVGKARPSRDRVEDMRNRMERDLVSELELSPDQQTNVHQIFLQSGEQMRKVHNDFEPRMKEIFEKAHTNIAAILTPEQREKYEKFTKERRERFEKYRDKGFGPPHHGDHPAQEKR